MKWVVKMELTPSPTFSQETVHVSRIYSFYSSQFTSGSNSFLPTSKYNMFDNTKNVVLEILLAPKIVHSKDNEITLKHCQD